MPAMRTPHPLTADGAFFVAPHEDRPADRDAGTTPDVLTSGPFSNILLLCTAPMASNISLFYQRVGPPAFLILGFGVTVAWTALLGYGLVRLVAMTL